MFGMRSSFTVCFGAWRQTCLASIDNTYFIVRYLAILQSVMRTLLSLRVTDPTKVADIDKWKGMCDPTTPVEITTEPSLIAVYSSILFEFSAALALSAQGIEADVQPLSALETNSSQWPFVRVGQKQ